MDSGRERARRQDGAVHKEADDLLAYYGARASRRRAAAIARATALGISARLVRACSDAAKRCVDIGVSGLLLAAGAPLFLAIAAAVKLGDGGPVLFWQTRVGRFGRTFAFPKFRTMCVGAEQKIAQIEHMNQHGTSVTFKMKHDPRITRVGRLLRRFSLDELPQLWCVFTGEMSLVGPRPPVPREVARYTLRDRVRLEAVPGLTCTWQVSGRSDIPFERQVELDRDYVYRQSIWLDLVLLLKTIPAVLTARGAY